jgi:2-polyprenyl-6-methoxyphenol 4-hydroxylase
MESDYHVVIVGGGMAGASLACHLAQSCGPDLRILLIERFAFPVSDSDQPLYQPSYDARSTALSYGSRRIYEQMGIWSQLSQHVTEIDAIHVSDRGHWGSTTLSANDENLSALGYVVENQWLGRVLLHRMSQFSQIHVLAPAQVKRIDNGERQAVVRLQSGGVVAGATCDSDSGGFADSGDRLQYTAELVVIADGVDSALARQIGIETQVSDYGYHALIANVCFRKPHNGRAYERFTDEGPMALLPLSRSEEGEPRSALVWTLTPDQAEELKDAPEGEFLDRLQQRFGYRQGRFTRVGQRYLYPLKLTFAKEQVRQRVVVLGNAAHTLHPVAGQGYNLVLRDVAGLSELLAQGFNDSACLPADLASLSDYLAAQLPDQQRTVAFSDYLPKMFSQRLLPLEVGRGASLVLMDILPPLKTGFVRFAAGLAGREARIKS